MSTEYVVAGPYKYLIVEDVHARANTLAYVSRHCSGLTSTQRSSLNLFIQT
jgi:hypothetical protein